MTAWRALLAVALLALSGCLATFDNPIPQSEPAPVGLMGKWVAKDAWGEHLNLDIHPATQGRYAAVSYHKGKAQPRDEALFTVSRHGGRWYASAPLPKTYGGKYAIVGFELSELGELVIYNLDVERIQQAIVQQGLHGKRFDTDDGEGVQVQSPPAEVFAYLDDPANSDVFVEIARYRRAAR